MRKTLLMLTMALSVAAVASVASGIAKNSRDTIEGVISDSHCGKGHSEPTDKAKSCVLACVKNGSEFVLVSGGRVYKLDQTGQDKAAEFAGERVEVTGSVSGESISVTSIERK